MIRIGFKNKKGDNRRNQQQTNALLRRTGICMECEYARALALKMSPSTFAYIHDNDNKKNILIIYSSYAVRNRRRNHLIWIWMKMVNLSFAPFRPIVVAHWFDEWKLTFFVSLSHTLSLSLSFPFIWLRCALNGWRICFAQFESTEINRKSRYSYAYNIKMLP